MLHAPISTHTPVRVWLFKNVIPCRAVWYFNSHTREGVTIPDVRRSVVSGISTHTPVRVWRRLFYRQSNDLPFQLTHPWGCDHRKGTPAHLHWISTHTPVRVWLCGDNRRHRGDNFNSHTREGVTLLIGPYIRIGEFQLTHPWGCDLEISIIYYIYEISTHTPVRVWLDEVDPNKLIYYFNSHTREGVTHLKCSNSK